jgi:putative DNA primase/helicase
MTARDLRGDSNSPRGGAARNLAELVPADLQALDQWVVWRWLKRNGKRTKVPYNARTGAQAASDDPATWSPFEVALRYLDRGRCDGVGFVFRADDPYTGIDLDKCRDPETGAIEPWALEIIKRLASYTEITPSGTGVHIILKAKLPPGRRRKGRVEMYETGRFFTMTGHHLDGTPRAIEDRHAELKALHVEVFSADKPAVPPSNVPKPARGAADAADAELIEKAKRSANGAKFSALWDGDTSGYDSPSEADAALCGLLAFWTGPDEERIDRLFRQSGLYRDKWERADYRAGTIELVLGGRTEYYQAPSRSRPRARPTSLAFLASFADKESQRPDTTGQPDVPPFPIDVLPDVARRYVGEAATALGVPPDMVAIPLLTFAGATIGSSQRIELKPGYWQRPILYTAVVAVPGSAKSPALDAARFPLDVLQREAIEAYKEALKGYEQELEEWSASPRATRGEKPERPLLEHYFTTDATLEALAAILEGSEGVTLCRDEIVGWVKSCDAYRGGRGGDRQQWLSLWAGAPLKVDRKKGEPVYVPFPVVCVAGGVQPELLTELADEAGRRDGFVERILWSYPDTAPAEWTEQTISLQAQTAILNLFRKLRRVSYDPVRLRGAARAQWVRWYNENARLTAEASGLAQGIYAKLPNQAGRLGLILHCLRYPDDPAAHLVDRDTLAGAIELAEYFRAHARRVLPNFGSTPPARSAGLEARVPRILERAGGEWVDRGELHKDLGGHTPAEALTEVLTRLESQGSAERRSLSTGGRPSEQWRCLRANEESEKSHSSLPRQRGNGSEANEQTQASPEQGDLFSLSSFARNEAGETVDGRGTASARPPLPCQTCGEPLPPDRWSICEPCFDKQYPE